MVLNTREITRPVLPDLHVGHKSHWSPTGIGRTCHQHIKTYGNDGSLIVSYLCYGTHLEYVFHKIIKFISNNSQNTLLFIYISIYKPFHCNLTLIWVILLFLPFPNYMYVYQFVLHWSSTKVYDIIKWLIRCILTF